MNDKNNNIEEKDIILTQIVDEFFERKMLGEKPTIKEYKTKYPEYAEEIERELEEELSWLAQFKKIKEIFPVVSTEKELRRDWERFRRKIIWEKEQEEKKPEKKFVWTLAGNICIEVSKLAQGIINIVIPENIRNEISFKPFAPAILSRREISNLEIPIPDIDGIIKISIFPPYEKENIQIRVQPKIKDAKIAKKMIHVKLKDLSEDKKEYDNIVQMITIGNNESAQTPILWTDRDYRICIQIEDEERSYEIPLKFIKD